MVTEYGGAPVSGAKEGQYYLELDENEERLPRADRQKQLTNRNCDIVFDHVGFAYQGGETVLKDVSFTAKQGQVTALVGPSGGGKAC